METESFFSSNLDIISLSFIDRKNIIKSLQSHHSTLKIFTFSKIAIFLIIFTGITLTNPNQSYSSEQDFKMLLKLSSDKKLALSVDKNEFDRLSKPLNMSDPLWPVHLFLVAEIQLLRGKDETALDLYRKITNWATNDTYQDNSGAIGLAAVALCRRLQLSLSHSQAKKVDMEDLVGRTRKLLDNRLIKRMFRFGVLPSLPQVRECIYKNLAHLAWQKGQESLSHELILNYIRFTSVDRLDKLTITILKKAYENKKATRARVNYYRALTLFSLAKFEEANRLLQYTISEGEPEIVHKAYLLQAKLQQNRGDDDEDVLYSLSQLIEDDPEPSIEQEARFMRAMIYKHKKINRKLFLKDLKYIKNEFPGGGRADDALLEIARDYQMVNQPQEALNYFSDIQSLKGQNDALYTAYIQEALTYYCIYDDKNDIAYLRKSIELFKKIRERYTTGVLRELSTFWLGRLHEEIGNTTSATKLFKELINQTPYSYYGLRAGLHLSYIDTLEDRKKSQACRIVMPDKVWLKKLADSISRFGGNKYPLLNSAYHTRLNTAISSGLYMDLLDKEEGLRALSPMNRLEEIEFEALDRGWWIPSLTLLTSFRLDAFAAMTKYSNPKNLIKVTSLVGNTAKDWGLTLSLITGNESQIINEPGYLDIAYPLLYQEELTKLPKSDYEFLPALLYSVMRRESHFVPSALSKRGAIGLFQFTPRSFEALNREYNLIYNSRFSHRQEYLLDQKLNLKLGGKVFNDLILPKFEGNILFSVMAHNIGYTPVNSWIDVWKKQALDNDVEYMIETARSLATRIFSRSVLADMTIIQAMGYFEK
ncbi:MAG: transglycosylase SLT domain-containing protein [bacterium]|nr:MAG: transglycosylase SLT domain-containing protein [bacterium]